MRWRKLGRVFVADQHSAWIHSHGVIPIARPIGDYRYRIYFNPRDREGRSNVSWIDIDIRDPTKVITLSKQPVIEPGELGFFDDNGAMGCWILEHDGHEILYYQGWNRGVTVSFYIAIGVAIRPLGNPDLPFERLSKGPILDRCMQEPMFAACPAVMMVNGQWHAWYQSGRSWIRGVDRAWPCYDIRYAVSADGVRWTLTGKQILTFAHRGEVAITRFCPLLEADARYRAWYSYRGNDWGYEIGYATSEDGVDWTRRDGLVGIVRDADSWEGPMICYPFVFDTEIGRFMLYNGGRYGAAGFGIAVLEQD